MAITSMRLQATLQWLWLNLKFLAGAFCLTGFLIWLFPSAMLDFYAKWTTLMQAAGAKNIAELSMQADMFKHILSANALTTLLFFAIGLVLQSPIAMSLAGIFYALVSFLAPLAVGRSFGVNDWFLVGSEAFTLLFGTSLASAIAGELFGVKATVPSIWGYWKNNWSKLMPTPVDNWKIVIRGWMRLFSIGAIILGGLLIFVAWFETYGY
ncbi:MAG: hypothetical protein QY306_03010 [Anaerolineales bacterium]|nr:MAG: hypothetical protein QY306_03010 [Anaerolineales bacterium]